MNRLVCFIGTDGSGKSTASSLMMKLLTNKGKKCRLVWGAYDLWMLRPIIRIAKRIFIGTVSPNKNYKKYINNVQIISNNAFVMYAYRTFVLFEYLIEIFIKVKIPLWLGYTVICDRYVFDTVINISSNMNIGNRKFKKILFKWLKLFPKPDWVIYTSVAPEISVMRKDDIPDIEYVKLRHHYYEYLSGIYPMEIFDGTLPLYQVENNLSRIASSILNK